MREEAGAPGTGPTVEAEFAVSSPRYPFVDLSDRGDCRVELEELLPREEGVSEFFSVNGADPTDVREFADREGIVDVELHAHGDAQGLFELVVARDCPVAYLARRGAVPVEVRATSGAGRIVAEILPGEDASDLIAAFLEEHAAELVAKRRRDEARPRFGRQDVRPAILDALTDRQREVLFAAFDAGYYDRPREATGEEIAADLGITGPTFQQHLRTAEWKVISELATKRTE